MSHPFQRTEMLIGKDKLDILQKSTIMVVGIGGVGSYTVEALARSGVGHLIIVDNDEIDITNINRQIHAFPSTVGMKKVDVMKDRILAINPEARVTCLDLFVGEDNIDQLLAYNVNYIVDAIDTITSKIHLVLKAKENSIPIVSSMGAGNKLDPTRFELADISKTSVCPIARVMRRELKKRGLTKGLRVVFSKEEPVKVFTEKRYPASIAFVPSVAGLILASSVVNELIKE